MDSMNQYMEEECSKAAFVICSFCFFSCTILVPFNQIFTLLKKQKVTITCTRTDKFNK